MNRLTVAVLSLILIAGATGNSAADAKNPKINNRVNHRQARQQVRITQGVGSGSLTKRETVKLGAAQQKLAANEQRMRQSGDGLTAKEHIKLEKQQDQLSNEIREQKHDDQSR